MKRISRSRAGRLTLLFVAALLLIGTALGALPAAAASAAPYTAEFYADGVLVASVPFDPETGITAEIMVPKKDGYTGAWEPYTLAEKDIQIQAVYTPVEGYQAPMDYPTVVNCLVVLIFILLLAILLLVILTLRARRILRANGLWGKKKKAKEEKKPVPAPKKAEPKEEPKKEKKPAEDRKAADKKAAEKEKKAEKDAPKTEEATATGKKSNASVEEKAENKEADSDPAPAEASKQQATASDPASASKASSAEQKPSQKQSAPAASSDREEMSTILVGKDGRRVQVKSRQSFRARIIGACEESKEYYNELKNYLLSFEDINAADSQNYESFSGGRRQIAKMNITGKTVILFLALDPERLKESKYKYEDVGNRTRYEKTPVKLKVRSARSAKWAKELIDMAMAENGRPFVALRNEKHVPDETMSREEMIRAGLVRVDARDMETGEKVDQATVIRMLEEGATSERPAGEKEETVDSSAVAAGAAVAATAEEEEDTEAEEGLLGEDFTLSDMRMMANVDLAPEDDYIPQMAEVTAEEAEVLVENAVAVQHIEHHAPQKASTGKKKRGQPAVLNIDVLDEHYAAGETVTLARLKADGLVAKKAHSLKILASGRLTKPLTVEADRFSLTAVKMILLTGGSPVLLDGE